MQILKLKASGILICLFLVFLLSSAKGQVALNLTITDNLITNAFTFDPPKPGVPKEKFTVKGDKGVQVFFYFNSAGTTEINPEGYRVRLTAYKMSEDKEEWFNELTYLLKKNDKYGIIAMNFFKPGQYKVVITENLDKTKVLNTSTFTVEQN